MANSKKSSTIAIFLCLNLVFFTVASSSNAPSASCSNALKLDVCANLLNWLISVRVGSPPKVQCCPLINGLVDLEASACLCTALKANVLGVITIDVDLALQLLLNSCGKNVPSGFKCA